MCGRYGQTRQAVERYPYRAKINVYGEVGVEIEDNYNLSPGNQSVILTRNKGSLLFEYRNAQFGYVPVWNEKLLLINARTEGKQGQKTNNENNDPDYAGPFTIGRQGAFSKAFGEWRCVVPCDYFIEGPEKEKLAKPYVIRRQDQEPFGMAGITSVTAEGKLTMAILTTAAAPLLRKVGHHRSPMVLSDNQIKHWLSEDISLEDLEKMIHPFDDREFEAYPVSAKLRPPNRREKPNNSPELIKPIGDAIKMN